MLGFFCSLLFTIPAFATDYYVATNGNNANAGTAAAPWLTVQYSVDQLSPGDILHVAAGVYNEKITLNVSGTSSQPILIEGNGISSTLDGTGLTAQTAMIAIVNQSYITISLLEIRNNVMNDAQGVLVDGNCQGIQILANHIHDIHFSANPNDVATASTNAQGIIVFGSDAVTPIGNLLISNNELYNCRLGYSEGIAVNGNVDGFRVAENVVHDLTNIGIVAIGHEQTCPDPALDQARNGTIEQNTAYNCQSPYAACGGIYIDGAKRIAVIRNSCHENDYGIEIGCEHSGKSADSITVRNNIVRFNRMAGIAFGGYDYPANSGKVTNSSVYNNTFYKNDSIYDGNGDLALSYFENGTFENNIFFTNDQLRAVTATVPVAALNLDYNLYFNTSGDQSNLIETTDGTYTLQTFQQVGSETNGAFGDPQFNTAVVDDQSFSMGFNFSPTSFNKGNPAYEPLLNETDFFQINRVLDTRVDIGASEFWEEGLAEQTIRVLRVSPNPTVNVFALAAGDVFEHYTIRSLMGEIVAQGTIVNSEVNMSGLPQGVYLVGFSGTKGTAQSRVVKLQ